jgi:murein DD-endopeptidase MepM/ murein hydrolase activator NlpD
MAKVKYYFDRKKLEFRKVELSLFQKLIRVFAYMAAVVVTAMLIISFAYRFLDSPKEKQLRAELQIMKDQFELLEAKNAQIEMVLNEIGKRDENIYRVIFEAEPIPAEMRMAGFTDPKRYEHLRNLGQAELVIETSAKIDKLAKQAYLQSKSFNELVGLIKRKSEMLASIPAIQPIRNRSLNLLASGFGYRIDPIYKTIKFHSGLDFNAPMHTPIFSTGNGRIADVVRNDRGYGNYILIDHGFGYRTLYGHMSGFAVKQGQKIKRGEIIGYVGNSGKSTGPHVHYEVIKAGEKINPINFFHSDLSPSQYETIIKRASTVNQSFD